MRMFFAILTCVSIVVLSSGGLWRAYQSYQIRKAVLAELESFKRDNSAQKITRCRCTFGSEDFTIHMSVGLRWLHDETYELSDIRSREVAFFVRPPGVECQNVDDVVSVIQRFAKSTKNGRQWSHTINE